MRLFVDKSASLHIFTVELSLCLQKAAQQNFLVYSFSWQQTVEGRIASWNRFGEGQAHPEVNQSQLIRFDCHILDTLSIIVLLSNIRFHHKP